MRKKGSVLLYSPYLDILGGGERHVLSILKVFEKNGYQVDVAWTQKDIFSRIYDKLRIDFKSARVIENFINLNAIEKYQRTSKYDYFIHVTDGSYFLSGAKHNYIFATVPDKKLYRMNFMNRLKLHNYSFIANGAFTAERMRRWTGRKVHVLHPFIDDVFYTKSKKKNIILSVGRFFDHLHSKRQDVLIKAFNKLQNHDEAFEKFKLVLVGGYKDLDEKYMNKLEKHAEGNKSIVIKKNVSFEKLVSLYHSAKIYWHAAGFGVDEFDTPDAVEHLGMTPLEAMAAGCIVYCHNSGGPKRLFSDGENAYLYDQIEDLVRKTSDGYNELQDSRDVPNAGVSFVRKNFSEKQFTVNVQDFFNL